MTSRTVPVEPTEDQTIQLLKERGIKGLIDMLLERAPQAVNDADGCLMITAAQALNLVYKGWHELRAAAPAASEQLAQQLADAIDLITQLEAKPADRIEQLTQQLADAQIAILAERERAAMWFEKCEQAEQSRDEVLEVPTTEMMHAGYERLQEPDLLGRSVTCYECGEIYKAMRALKTQPSDRIEQLTQQLAEAETALAQSHDYKKLWDELRLANRELEAALALAEQSRDDVTVIGTHSGTTYHREWWTGGTWLYPGDEVVERKTFKTQPAPTLPAKP